MSTDYTGESLSFSLDETGQPAHFLRGTPVRSGTLLELRLASRSSMPQTETWVPIRYELHVHEAPSGATRIQAVAHLLVAATTGEHEAAFELPADAYLRWYDITRAPAKTLSASDRARLHECADTIETSWQGLQDAYLDSQSGLQDLSRRLLSLEPGLTFEAEALRRLAGHPGPVWPNDIAFLERLVRQLEEFVARARRQGTSSRMSAAAQTALRLDGGQLLIESGYLRDLQMRLSS